MSGTERFEKGILEKLLHLEKATGMKLTESYAMWPASSVRGLYFAHLEARHFTLEKTELDSVDDYAYARIKVVGSSGWSAGWDRA